MRTQTEVPKHQKKLCTWIPGLICTSVLELADKPLYATKSPAFPVGWWAKFCNCFFLTIMEHNKDAIRRVPEVIKSKKHRSLKRWQHKQLKTVCGENSPQMSDCANLCWKQQNSNWEKALILQIPHLERLANIRKQKKMHSGKRKKCSSCLYSQAHPFR